MRSLVVSLLVIIAIAGALGAGASAVVARSALEPQGFGEALLAALRSPAGAAAVGTAAADAVRERSGTEPVAEAAARWAEAALRRPEAADVAAPAAIALQQAILTGRPPGSLELDARALARAVEPPPAVQAALLDREGAVVIVVPWRAPSPGAVRVLQQLDRHRRAPALLAVLAAVAAILALILARRRALVLIALGLVLAAIAIASVVVAVDSAAAAAVATAPVSAERALVEQLLDGWTAVGLALTAIGVALVLVGAAFARRAS